MKTAQVFATVVRGGTISEPRQCGARLSGARLGVVWYGSAVRGSPIQGEAGLTGPLLLCAT